MESIRYYSAYLTSDKVLIFSNVYLRPHSPLIYIGYSHFYFLEDYPTPIHTLFICFKCSLYILEHDESSRSLSFGLHRAESFMYLPEDSRKSQFLGELRFTSTTTLLSHTHGSSYYGSLYLPTPLILYNSIPGLGVHIYYFQ